MPAHKKYDPSLDDVRMVISHIKERNKLYADASELQEQIRVLEKDMLQKRASARLLSCKNIAEKVGLNKDIVHRISLCQYRKELVKQADPEFYDSLK